MAASNKDYVKNPLWFVRITNGGEYRFIYKVNKVGMVTNKESKTAYIQKWAEIRNNQYRYLGSNIFDQLVFRKRKGVIMHVTDDEIRELLEQECKTELQKAADFRALRRDFNKPIEDDTPRWCRARDTTASTDIWIPFESNEELNLYIRG